jgi:hypothetical protein
VTSQQLHTDNKFLTYNDWTVVLHGTVNVCLGIYASDYGRLAYMSFSCIRSIMTILLDILEGKMYHISDSRYCYDVSIIPRKDTGNIIFMSDTWLLLTLNFVLIYSVCLYLKLRGITLLFRVYNNMRIVS